MLYLSHTPTPCTYIVEIDAREKLVLQLTFLYELQVLKDQCESVELRKVGMSPIN